MSHPMNPAPDHPTTPPGRARASTAGHGPAAAAEPAAASSSPAAAVGVAAAALPPLLDIRGLSVRYRVRRGWVEAVRAVDLEVRAGQTVALVGESGSGKSTTGHAVLGLLPESAGIGAGRIVFDGEDVTSMGERRRRSLRGRDIALIPQDPGTALNPVQRIGRQVAEALTVHGLADRRAARAAALDLLADAGVPDPAARAGQYPHELSGGLRQRVLIAIAIAARPRLIVADEPTSALDVIVQRQILDHIESLTRASGMGVLLITHDLAVAAERADRIAVMSRGVIVETGPAARVVADPQHPYTRALVAAAPALTPRPRAASAPIRPKDARPAPAAPPDSVRRDAAPSPNPAPRLTARDRPTSVPRLTAQEQAPSASAPRLVAEDRAPTTGDPTPTAVDPTSTAGDRTPVAVPPRAPAARVEHLVKDYRLPRAGGIALRAVDDVTFDVPAGGTFALVGESGSGKSTVARLLLRLAEPTAGRVQVAGTDVTGHRGRELRPLRRQAQLVYQNPYESLNPRMSVGQIVRDPLAAHGIGTRRERRARAAELIDLVALPAAVLDRRPAELSGGQRQRVAIARALAPGPGLLVCDEPVSALDVSVQAQILDLLAALQEQLGLSYLFISHDLAVVRQIAHQVGVMQQGRLVESGPADSLLTCPGHPYTQALLAAVPGRTAEPPPAHHP